MAQISLKWLLQKPYVPSVVIGVRTLAQFTDNMAAAGDWTLSQEEVTILTENTSAHSSYAPFCSQEYNPASGPHRN